jgi:type III pantothenate kinase
MVGAFQARPCFALAIGNSRLHWLWQEPPEPPVIWHTPHLSATAIAHWVAHRGRTDALPGLGEQGSDRPYRPHWRDHPPLLTLASVVPEQTRRWQAAYGPTYCIQLEDIALDGLYPTLGIDRALALWGLIQECSAPALVIDAGTALTVTGADGHHRLVGGAIMPGLALQLRSLGQSTAALPQLTLRSDARPPLWATTTSEAIASGVLHGLGAAVRQRLVAWRQRYPNSAIALTGGDGPVLDAQLRATDPELMAGVYLMPDLLLQSMQRWIQSQASDP